MDSENSVFDRRTTNDTLIGAGLYNLVIGLTLLWGFAVNYIMVSHIDPEAIASVNPWIFFIGYFASCFFGIYLFQTSSNPSSALLVTTLWSCPSA